MTTLHQLQCQKKEKTTVYVLGETPVKAVLEEASLEQGAKVHLAFRPDQTRLYRDGWIATEAGT